jgi:hypothetical protein
MDESGMKYHKLKRTWWLLCPLPEDYKRIMGEQRNKPVKALWIWFIWHWEQQNTEKMNIIF